MALVLKAVSHPAFGDIQVHDSLFAIGRQEAPFKADQSGAVAKLSRRHARIFEQDGQYFLVDTKSLNGTWLNGKRLGHQAASLHDGDEVNFANQLVFRVELPPPATDQTPQQIQLALTPVDSKLGLDTLVVTHFPFLISQSEGAFSRYRDNCPDQLELLSRRHAHIFLKQDQLCIEDLGSTNGTFIGERRLDEHAVPIKSGDILTFGSPAFRYRVALPEAPDPTVCVQPDSAMPASEVDEPRTTFINSASPFLDIFCQQQAAATPDEGDEAPEQATPSPATGRSRVFLRELLQALGVGGKPASTGGRWLAVVIVLLLAAGAVLLYRRGEPEREMQELMAQAQYRDASLLADRYLKQHPQDSEFQALASEALIKGTVPQWQQDLQHRNYGAARDRLDAATVLSESHSEGRQLLVLLRWLTDLDQFFTGRQDDTVEMFHDEKLITGLLARWKSQGNDARRLLNLIGDQVPGFAPLKTRTFSHLHQLEYERSTYLAAIDSMVQQLQTLLTKDRFDDLTRLLDAFAQQYPKIRGVDLLRDDLKGFRALQQAIGRQDFDAFDQLDPHFRTPPFQQAARDRLVPAIPPQQVIEMHQQARQAWQAGHAQQAIALLEPGLKQPWGAALGRQLHHYRRVSAEYRALQAGNGAPDYGPKLIAFYSTLTPDRDRFYLEALRSAFEQRAEEARRNADKALVAARDAWQQYQKQGGITSALRLEGSVSDLYRQRAKLLGQANQQALRGNRLYALLKQSPAPAWETLSRQIETELRGQRQWLQDLSTVLDPPLLHAKLELLAPAEEATDE